MGKSLADHLSDAETKSARQTYAQAIFKAPKGTCLNRQFLAPNHGNIPSVSLGEWFKENTVQVFEHPPTHAEQNPLLPVHHGRLADALKETFQINRNRRRLVELKLPEEFVNFPKKRLVQVADLVKKLAEENEMEINLVNRDEGCTCLSFEMSEVALDKLLDAFDAGELESLGVKSISEGTSAKILVPDPVRLAPRLSDVSDVMDRFWTQTARRQWLLGPWRRLWCLVSPWVFVSSLREVIANTNDRFLAADKGPDQIRCLREDLRGAFLFWPVLTSILVVILSLFLSVFGVPVNIPFGVLSGLALALVGSLPCSYVISPLACGAGAVFIGTAFGVANALACGAAGGLSALPQVMESAPRFNLIVGGIFGATVKIWKPLTPAVVFAVVTLTAGGIALAAWLMGQPYVAAGEKRRSVSRRILGVLEGAFLGGIGIGIIFGLTALLSAVLPMHWSVSIPTAVIGSAAMAASVWLRTGNPKKSIAYAGLQCVIIGSLLAIMFGASNGSFRVLSNAMLTGYFHATFFTLAFIIGARRGGAQAGVWAAIVEGVGGYIGFIISQLLTT